MANATAAIANLAGRPAGSRMSSIYAPAGHLVPRGTGWRELSTTACSLPWITGLTVAAGRGNIRHPRRDSPGSEIREGFEETRPRTERTAPDRQPQAETETPEAALPAPVPREGRAPR